MKQSADRNSVDDAESALAKQKLDIAAVTCDDFIQTGSFPARNDVRTRGKSEMSLPNSRSCLSKRDLIRKTLREKEKQLSDMMKSPSRTSLNGDQLPPTRIVMLEEKREADRREAVKVLSQAALQLKRKLSLEKENSIRLEKKASILVLSLEKQREETYSMETKLEELRSENEHNVERLQQLQIDVVEKAALISKLRSQNQQYKGKESKMQNDFLLCRESMSEAEQVDYFKYKLFAKNNEIYDLRQEMKKMLEKVVALEVDLEIHQHYSIDHYSKVNSKGGTNTCSDDSLSKELSTEPLSALGAETKKRPGLVGLKRIFRAKGRTKNTETVTSTIGDGGEYSNTALHFANNNLKKLETSYKKDKYESRMHIERLKQENDELLLNRLALEKALKNNRASDNSKDSAKNGLSTTLNLPNGDQRETFIDSESENKMISIEDAYVNDRIHTLKNVRDEHIRTIERLRGDLDSQKVEAEKKLYDVEQLLEIKDSKIAALECELTEASAGNDNNSRKALYLNKVMGLEAKLQALMSEVIRLRMEQEMKENQIDTLRRETIELRLARLQDDKSSSCSFECQEKASLTSIDEDDSETASSLQRPEIKDNIQAR
mmetsp:Transcript_1520/g.2069  ORF Transcript_1520/g.2069 Transcript_1520/m.2069 type:complete len:605 (-) Transcript_1520:54-1868(-)|eukprot:CAMPEP_0178896588 /NCGR_PEP_ID=MMETSP0786-20121207/1262_1 /TAXON_ID=186022 /ORGANISM="Thalassionema frauenfeldii, Strain CCMP 1798" /LENGTH=604 /DNA_ID=CAMNT_0020567019 /DNA_START=144 /DNA_END=1958 /DNA_ORIENTATION=+